tara:strand:+ start:19774 stop:20118 length:345 start_codon:yes stop_codon:yes gene_type:complete
VVVAFEELDSKSRISPFVPPASAAVVPRRRPARSTSAEAAMRLQLIRFKVVHIVFMVMRVTPRECAPAPDSTIEQGEETLVLIAPAHHTDKKYVYKKYRLRSEQITIFCRLDVF